MNYTTLSLAQVQAGLDAAAADAEAAFGRLDARQVNWRPDATKWSVAHCLEHLLAANRLMTPAGAGVPVMTAELRGATPDDAAHRPSALEVGRFIEASRAPGFSLDEEIAAVGSGAAGFARAVRRAVSAETRP